MERKYTQERLIHSETVPPNCNGYMVHITLQLQDSGKLHVIAVYMPVTTAHAADRQHVYEHLSTVLNTLPEGDIMLVSGDWNAALYAQDRDNDIRYSLDTQHATWVKAQAGVQSIYTLLHCRSPTYSLAGLGSSPSMIDDTLLQAGQFDPRTLVHRAEIHADHGYNTDHAVLVADVNAQMIGLPTPQCSCTAKEQLRRPEKRLKTPVTKDDQDAFQLALLETQATEILLLEQRLQSLIDTDAGPFIQAQRHYDSAKLRQLQTRDGQDARG